MFGNVEKIENYLKYWKIFETIENFVRPVPVS